MANGKEITSTAWGIIRALVIAAVLGAATVAATQIALVNRVETAEKVQEKNQPAIDSIDVLKAAVVDLEKDFEKLDAKMDDQHKEVLDAIRGAR